jgi:hypothetical protein
MPTINPTNKPGEGQLTIWAGLATGDDGAAIGLLGSGERTFVAFGTFGGATVTLEGSLDEAEWFTLKDPQGANIALTARGMRTVLEAPQYVRPVVTGGSGASITAQVLVRRTA